MTTGVDLIGDLVALDETGAPTLEAVRSAVEAAVAGGQPYALHAGAGGGSLAAAALAAPSQPARHSIPADPLTMVLRRDLPLQPASGPGALPAWAVGRAATTLGRFSGSVGQHVIVDTFPPVEGSSLRRSAQATPLLVVAGTTLDWGPGGTGTIGAGTVWLPTAQFDPTVPAASWCGLTVSGGTISGAQATLGPAGVLVVPDRATLTVTLRLAPPRPPAGDGPGADARAADVRLPAQATFLLAPAGASASAVAPALLTAFGATVRLDGLSGPARYLPALGALLIPLTCSPAPWEPAQHLSTLAALEGSGAVEAAGWALPVTVADPATLGAAAGAGELALQVTGLTLAVLGQKPLLTGDAWIAAQPGMLTIASDDAVGTGAGGQIWLYPDPQGGSGVGGRAVYRLGDGFSLRYLSSASGTESVFARADLEVSLDRPVTVAGDRLPLQASGGFLAFVQQASGTTVLLEGTGDAPRPHPLMLALENALLETGFPYLFLVRAEVTSQDPELDALTGAAAVLLPLGGALPTLPDPYASTITPIPRRDAIPAGTTLAGAARAANLLLALLAWDARGGPAAPQLSFRRLAGGAGGFAWTGVEPITTNQASRVAVARPAGIGTAAASAVAGLAASREPTDTQRLAQLWALDEQFTNSRPGPIALLDVSTAAAQFGVRYSTPTTAGTDRATTTPRSAGDAVAAAPSGPVIEGLSIVAPANTVRVITLPAVQWEPVSGPDATGPFSPMAFPNSGGETEITSASVNLVEVAPNTAIKELLADYDRRQAPSAAVASISFPFGIRAVAILRHPRLLVGFDRGGALLDLHEPDFPDDGVTGGQQLRATSLGGPGAAAGKSASFPGATVQLRNGLHNGAPTGTSALDTTITTIFNDEFAVGGWAPQVPVGRFELSGYGESLFSDWKDNTDTDPSISQVRFDVLVGRTSVEVVQARTVLYPYAVRVIRTIKMLRDNAGRMQRTDSGWQAVADGRYQWPAGDPDLHSHPGVVLGVTNVKNIVETGQTWTSPDGVQFAAVRFDCLVDLEGVVSGAGTGGVPSHGQLGFLQVTHTPPQGMATSFRDLIGQFGPLGGGVDAVVDVGGSGQRARVSSVGVGVTEGTTGPEFAMAAWGSPILPRGGPWSVVRRAAGNPTPGPVDPARGVPLIRAGVAGTTPSPSTSYRFADPEDLANESSPANDYALLHSAETQRVLFPRPKVDVSGARQHQLSSTQQPLVADAFLMATAGVAPFPSVQDAIEFPDADYGLLPEAGGNLRLDLVHNDFAVTGGDRVIHDAGGTTVFARYRDESGTPSVVHLEIDSAAVAAWSFQLSGMELGLSTSLMGEILRLLGTVEGAATQAGRFTQGTFHFGSALSAVDMITSFLGTNHLRDLPLSSRNQPSLEIALKIPIVGGPGEPEDIDVGIGTLADADVTVGWKFDLNSGETSAKFELEGIITGRTPFPPIVVAGEAKFEIESASSGNEFKLTIGLGAGVQFNFGFGKVEGYFFDTFYLVVGSSEIGFGVGNELKATVDLGVVSVEIDAEAASLMIETTCAAGSTWWLVGQMTIGIDVTIAWVIDIDFEYQWQFNTNTNGGPCTTPPMV